MKHLGLILLLCAAIIQAHALGHSFTKGKEVDLNNKINEAFRDEGRASEHILGSTNNGPSAGAIEAIKRRTPDSRLKLKGEPSLVDSISDLDILEEIENPLTDNEA